MSLDVQFNKNDGSLIDIIDSALFNFNKKIATLWQDKTGRDKSDLEKVLYYGAAVALGGYGINTKSYLMIPVSLSYAELGLNESLRPKSNKHDEIKDEFFGLPKKTTKYLNVILYGFAAYNLFYGIGDLIAGVESGTEELYVGGINTILLGIGFINKISADYMAKSDIGTPKPKPKKKPIYEKIKSKIGEFLPQPKLKPIPIKNYSTITNNFKI